MITLKSWPHNFGRIVGKVYDLDCRVGLKLQTSDVLLYREYSPMLPAPEVKS